MPAGVAFSTFGGPYFTARVEGGVSGGIFATRFPPGISGEGRYAVALSAGGFAAGPWEEDYVNWERQDEELYSFGVRPAVVAAICGALLAGGLIGERERVVAVRPQKNPWKRAGLVELMDSCDLTPDRW